MSDRRQRTDHPPDDAVSLAVQLLAKEVQARLRRHPSAHLLNDGDSVELRLRLPTLDRGDWIQAARDTASDEIDAALNRIVLHRSVFRAGHVYCLRCASSECEHSTPAQANEVFGGYSPSGVPLFLDFGQWLLQRQDPRVDQLYRRPAGLVAHVTPGEELTARLLPAFRDADSGYHIHGQVTAGWYHFPTASGAPTSVALTYQIVSTRPRSGRRRLGLNLIGVGPEDEPLETLFDHTGELPWLDATRWAQAILRDIERSIRRRPKRGLERYEEQMEKRLAGLLSGLARRLQHQRRSADRKTRHGRQRHRERSRPTAKALSDLERASDDQVLRDTRRDTMVVLGDRGRAHIFNRSGLLVTSIHYSTAAIERRRKRGLWKPASDDQIGALKKQVILKLEGEEG